MQDTCNRGVTGVFQSRSSKRGPAQGESRRKGKWSAFLIILFVAILQFQQGGRALPLATDALRYFNTFFITGDVVSGGTGLWNTGQGTINVGAAPAGAEPLGAFLYWQVVTSANPSIVDVNAGATFNDVPLNVPLGTQLQPTERGVELGTQACPLNGGASRRVHTFRADVLSFLDSDPATGLRIINKVGGYPIAFPTGGRVLGASLVVLYRSPDPAARLNAIVIYDGTFVKHQSATLRQRIEGFYDPANVPGRLTYIGGGAQGSLGDTLTGPFATINNLFNASAGSAWDNVGRTTNPIAAGAASFDTAIAPQYGGLLSALNDCITMSAMIYQTEVNDADGDGLLNVWETSGGTLRDPKGNPIPTFSAMGAQVGVKDVFIEIAGMEAPPETTYGSETAPLTSTLASVTDHKGHLHIPPPAVLKTWGDPFAAKGIRVHFDVGDPVAYKSRRAYPTQPLDQSPYNSAVADDYIIGAGGLSGGDPSQARGGEIVQETACVPSAGPPVVDCQFPDYPGTVVWKTGFEQYKEQLFDGTRKDSFRFAFYAHAKASPKSTIPCLGAEGTPAGLDPLTGACLGGAPNPLIHVPAGVSGSGELNGGDFLVSLGLWDNTDFVGTDDGIAFTSMHELGHTLGLGHGGNTAANCKPNYLSLMNYTFQLGGLIDVAGNARADFSGAVLNPIDELQATDGYTIPGPFRTSWFAPRPAGATQQALKRFCNGLKFDPLAPPPATIRVDGDVDKLTSLNTPIDWNQDGAINSGGQDVNFDGEPDAVPVPGEPSTILTGYDDWGNIRLNQVGSRRNFAGISIGPLGVKFLSDGSKLLADGSVLLPDGSRLLADGSKLLADGSKLLADGAKFLADGSIVLADGSVLLADGVRLLSDGSRLLADGSKLLADGSKLLADGARLLADGSVLLADGSVLLADGTVFLADGSVLLGDGVRFLSDGSLLVADGSRLLAGGLALAWHFAETTPDAAAESGTIAGPTSLSACVIGGAGVNACGPGAPTEPIHGVFLTWKAPLGNVDHYVLHRAEGGTTGPVTERKIVPATDTSVVDGIASPPGQFTYVIEAVLADEDKTVTPESNEATIISENVKPVATAQSVTVWEDWLSDPITLSGTDVDSPGVAPFSVQNPSAEGGAVTASLPTVSYQSALNFNGADSFTFTVAETTGSNQVSEPAAVSLTVIPVNDKPTFTKGANQTAAQSAGAQTVAGWATGFDAGPADEDLTQSVLEYIVSTNNNALFEAAGQPAIAANGTLTYRPKAGGAPGVATVTVQVRDNGGISEGHGAVDTSDPQVFTITITSPATSITFQSTDVLLSTSSSNRTYDLKAEILKNGVPVLEKVVSSCSLGFGTTINKAINEVIGNFANTAVGFAASDTLSVRVSLRVSSSSPGGNSASGAIRLWYNVKTPSGDSSHIRATRAGTAVKYYLMPGFQLQKNGVVAGPTMSIDQVVFKTTYTVLGTWSTVGP